MGIWSVITTILICIIFNMLLPSGDVGSDLYLMYNTLTFNLGIGLKLIGCKVCYRKTEDDVYYGLNKMRNKSCNWCVTDKGSGCGLYPKILEKILSYQKTEMCEANYTLRRTNISTFETGECDIDNDVCCLSSANEHKRMNEIQALDAKKLFRCFIWNKLKYCYVIGNTSFRNCMSLKKKSKDFKTQRKKILTDMHSSSDVKRLYFFNLLFNNRSVVMQQVDSMEEIKACGLLLKRLSKVLHDQAKRMEYCNEDSCLTHLKTIHSRSTKITDLSSWRANDDYVFGISIGGATCRMLQIYSLAMLFPILLNLAFNLNVFAEDLKQKNATFIEIVPVLMLMYPQYKTFKILLRYAFYHRDENQLNYDKEDIERRISPLEPFLESCLQVNVSLAILFTTDGFYPKNEYGKSLLSFSTISSCFPILTFLLSLFAASFGTSKFFLSGPVQFLSKSSSFGGLLSKPFITMCILNCMFGIRTICIESAFFSSFRYENETDWHFDSKRIDPILPPELRLPVYFAPCLISLLVNWFRIWFTTKGLGKYFVTYPQFLLASCFTPFMFEGCRTGTSKNLCKIKIWKFGTIINALYIGILPQCILLLADYLRGVQSWNFIGNTLWEEEKKKPIFEINDALFKHPFGNTIFALTSGILFLVLIILFFNNQCIHCFNYSDPILDIALASGSIKNTIQHKKNSKVYVAKVSLPLRNQKVEVEEEDRPKSCRDQSEELNTDSIQQVTDRKDNQENSIRLKNKLRPLESETKPQKSTFKAENISCKIIKTKNSFTSDNGNKESNLETMNIVPLRELNDEEKQEMTVETNGDITKSKESFQIEGPKTGNCQSLEMIEIEEENCIFSAEMTKI